MVSIDGSRAKAFSSRGRALRSASQISTAGWSSAINVGRRKSSPQVTMISSTAALRPRSRNSARLRMAAEIGEPLYWISVYEWR